MDREPIQWVCAAIALLLVFFAGHFLLELLGSGLALEAIGLILFGAVVALAMLAGVGLYALIERILR